VIPAATFDSWDDQPGQIYIQYRCFESSSHAPAYLLAEDTYQRGAPTAYERSPGSSYLYYPNPVSLADYTANVLPAITGRSQIQWHFNEAITLAQTGIESTPGWEANANPILADLVLFNDSLYFHDGTDWRQWAAGSPISNNQALPIQFVDYTSPLGAPLIARYTA